MTTEQPKLAQNQGKLVSNKEFIAYLAALFLYSNMVGVIGFGMRNKYLEGLGIAGETAGLINGITGVAGILLPFIYSMIVDRAPKPGKPKFKPLILLSVIPAAIFTCLMFYTPAVLVHGGLPIMLMIAYQCTITILHGGVKFFGDTINQLAVVMSPNHSERDKLLSFRGIASAIAASAPMVVVLVVGLLKAPGILSGDAQVFLLSAVISGIAGVAAVFLGMRVVKERVTYSSVKVNPLLGFRDIIKNKYARIVMLSEFLKNFRTIAGFMQVFLVTALLGDATKLVLFGLPTAAGTFVGMLAVNFLLKKINSKQIVIMSGMYSMVINGAVFATGLLYFRHPGEIFYTVLFFFFLFLVGIQFGASNLLPNMFKADVLESLEAQTHKRLESSLDFVVGIGSNISGMLSNVLAPMFLYGTSVLNFIGYQRAVDGVEQVQSDRTKILILLVYTIGQGVFQLLCALPFLFYKLTGAHKEAVHEEVMAYRASISEGESEEEAG